MDLGVAYFGFQALEYSGTEKTGEENEGEPKEGRSEGSQNARVIYGTKTGRSGEGVGVTATN